jgi:hypothetical protein
MSKASKIYRKAAEMLISDEDFSCLAVRSAALRMREPAFIYVDAYQELFFPPDRLNKYSPEEGKFCGFKKGEAWGQAWSGAPIEVDNCRILALLFMSEIVKGSEDDSD